LVPQRNDCGWSWSIRIVISTAIDANIDPVCGIGKTQHLTGG
jgi:hypothetical protein